MSRRPVLLPLELNGEREDIYIHTHTYVHTHTMMLCIGLASGHRLGELIIKALNNGQQKRKNNVRDVIIVLFA